MPTHAESRAVDYTPEQLYDLVADIGRYPQFLPWCVGARVRNKTETSAVCRPDHRLRPVPRKLHQPCHARPAQPRHRRLRKGPFRYLNNHWTFAPDPKGCKVDFFVDFEFRSRILQAAIGVVFHEAVRLMVNAFLTRARVVVQPAPRHVRRRRPAEPRAG
jgi:coenzyme Q-binding protein COQ10